MAATSPYEGTCAGPGTGDTIIMSYTIYAADACVASVPADLPQPPTQNHFPHAGKMVGPRRVRGQVVGVHRALRFLQRPLCRGGMK